MRRLHRTHRGGAAGKLPGVVEARLNFTNQRLTVAWRDGELAPCASSTRWSGIGYRGHPSSRRTAESDDAKQRRRWLLRCLAVAGFAAMNIMLLSVSVWSGNVTDITPETRDLFHWLSALIALPAAAYAGQPFFRSALARAARRRSSTWTCRSRSASSLALGMSLFETANHAEHAYFDSAMMLLFFLLCRPLARPGDARAGTRAVAGNLAALKADVGASPRCATASSCDGAGRGAACRATASWCARASGSRPTATSSLAALGARREPGHRRNRAPRRVATGAAVYAGSLNFTRRPDDVASTAAGDRTLLDEIERLLEKAADGASRAMSVSPTAPRGSMRRSSMPRRALTLIGWLICRRLAARR